MSANEYYTTELNRINAECSTFGWNGYEALPVQEKSVKWARNLIDIMPETLPKAEVSVDPDGEVSLDWIGNGLMSISISTQGRCAFAGRNIYGTIRGMFWIRDIFPKYIEQFILELIR